MSLRLFLVFTLLPLLVIAQNSGTLKVKRPDTLAQDPMDLNSVIGRIRISTSYAKTQRTLYVGKINTIHVRTFLDCIVTVAPKKLVEHYVFDSKSARGELNNIRLIPLDTGSLLVSVYSKIYPDLLLASAKFNIEEAGDPNASCMKWAGDSVKWSQLRSSGYYTLKVYYPTGIKFLPFIRPFVSSFEVVIKRKDQQDKVFSSDSRYIPSHSELWYAIKSVDAGDLVLFQNIKTRRRIQNIETGEITGEVAGTLKPFELLIW